MCRMRPCLHAAGCIAVLSLVFLLAGMFVPLWNYTDDGTTRTFWGLWFSVSCPSSGCVAVPFDKTDAFLSSILDLAWLVSAGWINRICILVGVVLVLIGTLIVDSCCCVRERSKGCHIVACVVLWLAGLETLGWVFSQVAWYVAIATNGYLTAAYFPWSYLFCALGGIFALIAAICLVSALCNWRQHDDYYDDRYGQDGRQIQMEQRQGWDKHGGYTNTGYQQPERRVQEQRQSTSKKAPVQEYNYYDRQHYDRVAQPPPYAHNQHGGNMYRPYVSSQRF